MPNNIVLDCEYSKINSICTCYINAKSNNSFYFTDSNSQIYFWSLVFQRIWRLLPTLAFVACFQLTLYKFFANGPHSQDLDYHRTCCELNIWKTLLFVSNFVQNSVSLFLFLVIVIFNQENNTKLDSIIALFKCIDVSWYTSVDMQLYIFAPFLVNLMQRNEFGFILFSITLILIDYFGIINGWATIVHG